MFLALSRGVPEAGMTFAVAMMLGVGLTLGLVALVTVLARDRLVGLLARHGTSLARVGRGLDGTTGAILILIGVRELLR
jgi:nickel/cobalt transporter (NicO) family protein